MLAGRAVVLVLPPDARVDVEPALAGAASCRVARPAASGRGLGRRACRVPVASRPLLPGTTFRGWTCGGDDSTTRSCAVWSASAAAWLGLGGPTPPRPRSAGASLLEHAPYRETGYRILMEALAQRGNVAEALRVYDRLRVRSATSSGSRPALPCSASYRRLLGEAAADDRVSAPRPARGCPRGTPCRPGPGWSCQVRLGLLPELVVVLAPHNPRTRS